MKTQKGFIPIFILAAIIVGVIIVGGVGYVGVKQYQNHQAEKIEKERHVEVENQKKESETKALVESQQKALGQAQTEIEKLKQESAATKEKQRKLESVINVQSGETNLPEIISFWRKSLAHIVCEWNYASGEAYLIATGSGWVYSLQALNSDGTRGLEFSVIGTNKHVVNDAGGYRPNRCEITFPDSVKIYKAGEEQGSIRRSSDYDNAFIAPSNPDLDLSLRRIKNYCKKGEPKVGDNILILGYPAIGSKNDITATEGIISGLDGDYFITSAKIDSGNSGGVAVLTKSSCFIGMPTYVKLGEAESLGRILNYWSIK